MANSCSLKRGLMDLSNPSAGLANVGDSTSAVGKPGENGILSLGDAGEAIIGFEQPIRNGIGADFAIFENSFSDRFLELAFVEVSSDGQTWVRFPSTCLLSQDTQIGPFDDTSDPEKINNLAGKYRGQYGVPFDLEELRDSSGINTDSINYIKLIDCVGSINNSYSTFDAQGNKINDPFPTPFASSGFDLDAVGVIHQNVVGTRTERKNNTFNVYPNPSSSFINIAIGGQESIETIVVCNLKGKMVFRADGLENTRNYIIEETFTIGIYMVKVKSGDTWWTQKLVIQ